jgi:hypothetical protein
MPCNACVSGSQKTFSAEMALHFLELKDVDKPVVWKLGELKGNENA